MDIFRLLLTTENVKMQYELVLMLFLLLVPVWKLKDRRKLALSLLAVFLFFIYLHRILLPFLVSGIWFFLLLSIGSLLIFTGKKRGMKEAFLLPAKTIGAQLYRFTEPGLLPFGVLVLLILLIQLCRINISIDYDSIRYGLRSDVLLSDNGIRGFFESMGLVNMVYTYPKGYELLLLPMLFGRTYGYALCLNVWILLAVLLTAGRITEQVTGGGTRAFVFTAAMTALVPGITNMAITAKSDLITLLCQLIFVLCVVRFLAEDTEHGGALVGLGTGALIASYAFKPTALIFSSLLGVTALFVLMLQKKKLRLDFCGLRALLLGGLYTAIMTVRTICITGMPFTSIFTGLLTRLGLTLKYPFREQSVVYGEDAAFTTEKLRFYLSRVIRVLFCPTGDDMAHVIMAWGGIAFILFLIAAIVLCGQTGKRLGELAALACVKGNTGAAAEAKEASGEAKTSGAMTAIPCRSAGSFLYAALAVIGGMSLISLWLLYQVDGNYFQLIYALAIITGSTALFAELRYELSELGTHAKAPLANSGTLSLIVLSVVMIYFTAFTSWTGAGGFTPMDFVNKGYYDHTLLYGINNPLGWDKDTRVVAFAYEPDCYKLEGRVESWVDIDGSGGNVYLTDTKLNIFKEYLTFADIDYIYADLYFINDPLNERHARANTLFSYLLEDGSFSELSVDPEAPNRVFAKIDKDRICLNWEVELTDAQKARTDAQIEQFAAIRE